MTDIVVNSDDVIVQVQQPTIPPTAPPPKIGLIEINQVVTRGTAWITGSGPPTGSGGQYGDMYLDVDTGDIYQWDGSAWNLEGTFAPSTLTPAEILAAMLTVDGAGSALDADLLDGQHGSYYAKQADLDANAAHDSTQDGQIGNNATQIAQNSSDITALQTATTPENLLTSIKTVDGAGSGLDADTLDGHDTSYFATAASLTAYAPIANPTFTGDPKAPTPTAGDNDTSIATTAFVTAAVAASAVGGPWAPIASPTFTGDPKAPTPATADSDTSIATTAFVKAQSYLTDAPNDGLTYGRKNNAWSAVVGGAIVSDTAPTGTLQNGQMWWESDTGNLYIYYNDGDSSQWIMVAAGTMTPPPIAGDLDMRGYSIINDLNLTASGTVTAGTNFVSSAANAVLATTGAGGIFLRPNGMASSAGQLIVDSTGQIIPASGGGIKGVTDGSNAAAGQVGEFYSNQVLGGAPGSSTPFSAVGATLTAGDWDVWGVMFLTNMGGSPGLSFMGASIATAPATMNYNYASAISMTGTTINVTTTVATPIFRANFTATSSIYLNGQLNFTSGNPSVNSYLYARRRR